MSSIVVVVPVVVAVDADTEWGSRTGWLSGCSITPKPAQQPQPALRPGGIEPPENWQAQVRAAEIADTL